MTVLRHPNNNGVTLSQWRKTAAGGETSLSGTDDFSAGLSYTVGAEQVFVNGVLIERGVDYTASTGTTVTGLTALVAGDIVTVSSPSSFQVANAIPKNTITAKGDLIVATGASTPANLAVGADGTTLVADSSTSTGLRYQGNYAAGKNAILNGSLSVSQRGNSFTTNGYCIDRWSFSSSSATGQSVNRTALTVGTSGIPAGIAWQADMAGTLSNASTGTINCGNVIEDVRTFDNTTATFSFYVKGTTSGTVGIRAEQNFGTGGSPSSTVRQVFTFNVTTSWQRITQTITFASISGKTLGTDNNSYVNIIFDKNLGTSYSLGYGTNPNYTGTMSWTGIQLEAGSVATAFQTATGTIQGELTACMRYYWRATATGAYSVFGGNCSADTSTTTLLGAFQNPVIMRTAATSVDYSTLLASDGFNNLAISALSLAASYTSTFASGFSATSSTLVAYRFYRVQANNSASAYIGFSAEL